MEVASLPREIWSVISISLSPYLVMEDPFVSENDAGLDPEHWTGTSGCVILAPHLIGTTKKELGLMSPGNRPAKKAACAGNETMNSTTTEAPSDPCRDASGRVVTAIADNYFDIAKKR